MNYAERFRTCRKCNTDFHISMFRFHANIKRHSRVCNLCISSASRERSAKYAGMASNRDPSAYWWHYERIMELGSAGASPMEIWTAIGKVGSISGFRNWIAFHKIPRGRWKPEISNVRKVSDELLEAIRERLHRKLTYGQIARQLDISRNRVAGYVHNYGLRQLKQRPETFTAMKDKRWAAPSPVAQPGDRAPAMPSTVRSDLPSDAGARSPPTLSRCS
jgi:hypothetical protein